MAPNVQHQLEAFTYVMYGQARENSLNAVRSKLLKKMVGEQNTLNSKSKVDLMRLPPCQTSLIPHVQRVNHRVACYKRAAESFFERPKPYDENQGWLKTEEGIIEPVWSVGPIMPSSLIDLFVETKDDEDKASEDAELNTEEILEIDYNDTLHEDE